MPSQPIATQQMSRAMRAHGVPGARFIGGAESGEATRTGRGCTAAGSATDRDGRAADSATNGYSTRPACRARGSDRVNKVLLHIPSDHAPCLAPTSQWSINCSAPGRKAAASKLRGSSRTCLALPAVEPVTSSTGPGRQCHASANRPHREP